MIPVLRADWPAPAWVHALQTLREPGSGADPVLDREALTAQLGLPEPARWLRQVHGIAVAAQPQAPPLAEADAAVTHEPGVVCAVMTADCLPVFLCHRDGSAVGVAHAGWRGLCAGVLEATVQALGRPGDELLAWFGGAIGPQAFEVGEEVRDAFLAVDPRAASAFVAGQPGKHYADLYALARQRLAAVGVTQAYGGGHCTFSDRERFHSYRRGARQGRMASLIWFDRPRIS